MEITRFLISKLQLKPHPEGGYFRETYRSCGEFPVSSTDTNISGVRNYSTCIYFLLRTPDFSSFHKINQDEIWHFYSGSPILLHIITPKGEYSNHIIGTNILQGEVPQFVVIGGNWFAAEVIEPRSYSLVGCTVSPGFTFKDFTLGKRRDLSKKFPQHTGIITRLTR